MIIQVKVPTVGESITEGVLSAWKVRDGAMVAADEVLFELETDKVSMSVTAEKGGKITLTAKNGDTVQIGQAVATIDTEAAAATPPNPNVVEALALTPTAGVETLKANLDCLAPSVRRIVAEEKLDPAAIVGTGKDGRITKADAVEASQSKAQSPKPKASETPPPPPPSIEGGEKAPSLLSTLNSQLSTPSTRRPMSPLRHRIAERMVESQHNSATLTTFNEVDMSAVMGLRGKIQEAFTAKFGVKIGIMSFFVKAAVEALKAVPEVNAFIDGDEIVENHFYDLGIAVSTEKGLIVPVLRGADQLDFAGIEVRIADFAERARKRTLTLDELQGGVFTISNGGVFGSLLSTPILNPPQPAILGLHTIKQRPIVTPDGMIEARPMMYLALSYDHRLIDGRESVAFLKKIVEYIEAPERLMLGL